MKKLKSGSLQNILLQNISLLKELGVAKDLSTLIEGESLLNDGTAMVVFLVLLEILEANESGEHAPVAWDIIK